MDLVKRASEIVASLGFTRVMGFTSELDGEPEKELITVVDGTSVFEVEAHYLPEADFEGYCFTKEGFKDNLLGYNLYVRKDEGVGDDREDRILLETFETPEEAQIELGHLMLAIVTGEEEYVFDL